MKRSAVLIPTSAGPLEAIVHEPDASPIACAVALPGVMSRAEANRKWARLADGVADLGIVVIRYNPLDLLDELAVSDDEAQAIAIEGIDWFRTRTNGLDLMLFGLCHGARACVTYAAANPANGVALVTPAFRTTLGSGRRTTVHALQLLTRVASRLGVRLPSGSRAIDPDVARALRAIGSNPQVWVLIGERDYQWRTWLDPSTRPRALASAHIEVVPGTQLHSSRTLESQNEMIDRVTAWAARTLTLRVTP